LFVLLLAIKIIVGLIDANYVLFVT